MTVAVPPPPLPAAERLARFFDGLAPRYDGAYSSRREVMENLALPTLLRRSGVLAPPPSAPDAVIDLGCGTGLLLDLLPRLDPARYVGVDLSGGMIRVARRKHPRHVFAQADMRRLAGYDRQASGVVSLFAVPNYAHPFDFAALLVRLLAPGGRYFVMAMAPGQRPKMHSPEVDDLLVEWEPEQASEHLTEAGLTCRVMPFTYPWEGAVLPVAALAAGQVLASLTRPLRASRGHRYVIYTGRN